MNTAKCISMFVQYDIPSV